MNSGLSMTGVGRQLSDGVNCWCRSSGSERAGDPRSKMERGLHVASRCCHSRARIATVTRSGFMSAGRGKAVPGHVDVDGFVVPRRYLIGLVPDADGTVGADALVEGYPGGQVARVTGLGIGQQIV